MRSSFARSLVSACGLLLAVAALPGRVAAQLPSPDQAAQMLQSNPELLAQLRSRIATSGMSPDQIRERLRAEGYPEHLLDAYLGTGGDSTGVTTPNETVFAAVKSLGITDDEDIEKMRQRSGLPPRPVQRGVRRPHRPSDAFVDLRLDDSLRVKNRAVDSLAVVDSLALDSLEVFGMDIFSGETSQFDPNKTGAVDDGYVVGPGDRLVLILTGDVESAYTLNVTREGFVVVPAIGEISVANLTMAQLRDLLYTRLRRVYSGLGRGSDGTTHFSISAAKVRSAQVYVIGDVMQPGSYRVGGNGTALTALYAAGGPSEIGSMRRIEIRRGGKVVSTLDLYDYLLRGDGSRDPHLENGDVVFVPPHLARVALAGEVLRPAIYEMKPGETLADLIQAAGGFGSAANRQRVQIERIVPPGQRTEPGRDRIVVDVSANDLTTGAASSTPMLAGDVVRVFPVADRMRNGVRVRGNVWVPGTVGLRPGMKLSDALRLAGGLKPDTYLGTVLISRLRPDSTRVQMRAELRDTSGAAYEDPTLQEDDEIQVFSSSEFRPTRYVSITGAVRRSGRYPFREGMTLRDLVLMAGGMEERAYLREAEIARLPEDRTGGKLATTIRVPLDSSYVLDRSPEAHYAGSPGSSVVQAGKVADQPLQPYDNVLILEQPDWALQRNVTVTGEVKYPGTYSLRSKGERLSDVIERAGGLTGEGYADGVYFYRKQGQMGRVGVDLERVLRKPDSRDNLVLQDGDSIAIPMYAATVKVSGGVNSPVAVAYVPGKNIDYYIDAAGGLSPRADVRRAYVTQPNGKVESRISRTLLPDSRPHPRAGSEVVVPLRDPNDKRDYVMAAQVASMAVQVLTGIIALVAVVRQVK